MTFGSLFAGIGGFDLAFHRAGMSCVWQAEKDASCLRVLAHHYPTVTRYTDVREVKEDAERPDLICGGFPCQDLSVAGKRAGLAGDRSGLFFEFIRILGALAPRWVCIENVPGLFSSAGGRDFAIVLSELVQLGYGVAWRVLDAQFFDVAQRRGRVFIVGCLGDAARAAAVLFEPESCDGDSPPSRETGARTSVDVAPCIRSSGQGTQRAGDSRGQDPLVYDISSDCFDRSGDGAGGSAGERAGLGIVEGYSPALRAKRPNGIAQVFQANGAGSFRTGAPSLAASDDNGSNQLVAWPLCANGKAAGDERGRCNDGRTSEECTFPLHAAKGQSEQQMVAFTPDVANSVRTQDRRVGQGWNTSMVGNGMSVRRLTPKECCRLQAFPDDWLDLTPPLSDSAKYKMLGNAVCVNVVEWIGKRIVEVESTP